MINRIVVLQRGWVVVGEVFKQDGEVTILNASIIRRWGTTEGLGELVNGPLPDTKLDFAGIIRVHPLAIVFELEVNKQKWN